MKKVSDIVLAVFVLAITAMLLIPLPTFLLDILLVINISFSLLLLLVGLYMPTALSLLSFPSMLLLTTLFRLGLNVASTRLILSQGDAGTVIQAFGTFLVRGEVIVGIIIFCIITIVNFIVIARGSSRVSEVAARFALDALPGKQASIDAEARAGTISSEEARHRREELRKESQLYGSMDGAMKFVQGDAIAGFFVIFTNILGGIYLGVTRGQSFSDAVSTYTILTVGDGLVNQIPALLISICAGIVVTRVYSSEGTTLGADLGRQLFNRPITVAVTGVILMLLAALPGLPVLPFMLVGTFFITSSILLQRSLKSEAAQVPLALDHPTGSIMMLSAPPVEEERDDDQKVEVLLDADILYKLYRQQAQRYSGWWQELRSDFLGEIGLRLPDLAIIPSGRLASSSFQIVFGGSVVASDEIMLDSVLVELSPESAEVLGLEVIRETNHPLTGSRVFWAARTSALHQITEAAEIRIFEFMEYIGLRIAAFFIAHPEEIFTISDIHLGLKQMEKRYPGIAADVFSRNFVDLARLAEVFQELVRQGLGVREFRQIVEAVASYCSLHGISVNDSSRISTGDLVSYIRTVRRRQVVGRLLSQRGTLKICTLDSEVEEAIESISLESQGTSLAMDPELFDQLRAGLRSFLRPVLLRGVPPLNILIRADLLERVQRFLVSCGESVKVVTFDELDPAVDIERVGRWSLMA